MHRRATATGREELAVRSVASPLRTVGGLRGAAGGRGEGVGRARLRIAGQGTGEGGCNP